LIFVRPQRGLRSKGQSYAGTIQETANGGRRSTRSEARTALEGEFARRFAQHGKVHDEIRVEGIGRDQTPPPSNPRREKAEVTIDTEG